MSCTLVTAKMANFLFADGHAEPVGLKTIARMRWFHGDFCARVLPETGGPVDNTGTMDPTPVY